MNERMTATVGARISEFRRKMAEVNKIARTTANDIVIDVKVNHQQAMRSFDRLSQGLYNLRNIMGEMGRGGLLMVSPAAVPTIAALAGGIGGLASSLSAAGGALGIFGIAAIGNASTLTKRMEEIKSINDKIKSEKESADPDQEKLNELLKQRTAILNGMSDAQKDAMKQVDGFTKAWQGFLKKTEDPVFQVFADGLRLASNLLSKIQPVVQPVADALSNLLNRFNDFSNTKQFKSFIDFFATRGSDSIKNWGTIAGNVFKGFMELMKAFAPLGKDMENGLIDMTGKFAKWAAGLSKSEAFKSFIDYVKTNGPTLLETFGNFTKLLINFGTSIAPLGQKVLELVNAFLGWAAEGLKNNQWIGKLIGFLPLLLGAFKILSPIILAGVSAFRFLKGIFKVIMPVLKNLWLNVGTKLWLAFQKFWNIIGKVIPWVVEIGSKLRWLTGPVGIVIGIIITLAIIVYKNWDKIWAWTKDIFSKIGAWIQKKWEQIKAAFEVVKILYNLLKSKLQQMRQAVYDKMNEIWSKIKDVWGNVTDFFSGINLYDSGKKIIQSAINGIKAMAGKVKKTVSGIAQKIRDFFPFSPAKEGPLSTLHRLDFAGPVTDSIRRGKAEIQRSMQSMLSMPAMAVGGMNVGAPDSYSSREETHVNMAGVFQGAELTIREDADIDRIAQALGERFKESKRARGIR